MNLLDLQPIHLRNTNQLHLQRSIYYYEAKVNSSPRDALLKNV